MADNLLYQGDCLEVMRALESESVGLVYVDPPFNLGYAQRNPMSGITYEDGMATQDYLLWLEECMVEVKRILKPYGSVYVHLSEKISYRVRYFVMDTVFGADNWLNTVIWSYDYGGRSKKLWPRKHEPILWFAKDANNYIFNYEDIERIPYMAPGLVGKEKAERGKVPTDVIWETIVPTQSKDRVDYPTQKPAKLIQRLVQASSKPSDVVLDFCAGSGTTAIASNRLGRPWIAIDRSPEAFRVMSQRFDHEGLKYTPIIMK